MSPLQYCPVDLCGPYDLFLSLGLGQRSTTSLEASDKDGESRDGSRITVTAD